MTSTGRYNRVDMDRKALAEIQSLYEQELDKILGRFETRGMPVRREAWDRYVAYSTSLIKICSGFPRAGPWT